MNPKELFNSTLFFLGAGASRDVDCMTSLDMLSDLQTKINGFEDKEKKETYKEIYQFIIACLNFQYSIESDGTDTTPTYQPNVEDFVRVLRQMIDRALIIPGPLVGTWNENLLKWEVNNKNILSELYEFILRQLRGDWTKFNKIKNTTFLKPIRELLTSTDLDQVNFFSLNYDLVFESYFITSEKRLLENGFDDITWTGNFSGIDKNKESKLNLFKLHGSLDWKYNEEVEVVELHQEDNDRPLIIFGIDNKMQSTDPFLFLLSHFREKLESAKLIVTIGYSYFDPYINNILLQKVNSSPQKKLLVVDPKYKNKSPQYFIDQLSSIQTKKSGTEMPNLSKISPEKVQLIGTRAREFFRRYFSNGAAKLGEIFLEIEESTTPFK